MSTPTTATFGPFYSGISGGGTKTAHPRCHRWRRSCRTKQRRLAARTHVRRPLWLTAQEARTLAVLSGSSPFSDGCSGSTSKSDDGQRVAAADEQLLFARLGRYLRSF